jgi:photosystem II stability/assembly factor-like uncharacterized protein
VKDGPDKPFLDLYFESEQEGFVVGSYGLIFHTRDGGESWQCRMDSTENPDGLNLYAIEMAGGKFYIAGEQGLFLISEDGGASFHQMQTPYSGTYFDMYASPAGELVLVGLRGNAFWSADGGQTFTKSQVESEVSFTKVTWCEHGILVFANQGGELLESRDKGRTIRVIRGIHRLNTVSSLVSTPSADHDHFVMTVGHGGAIPVKLPSQNTGNEGGPS